VPDASVANGGKFNFSIMNTINGQTLSLPAYIDSVGENVSTTWETVSLINRSEDLYIYNRAARDYSLSFWIFATHDLNDIESNVLSTQIDYPTTVVIGGKDNVGLISKRQMWGSINFLHTLTRPQYDSSGKYLAAPYCMLRVGDLFNHKVIIESMSIDYNDLVWDINIDVGAISDGIKPMMAKITLNGKILHGGSPSINTEFYSGPQAYNGEQSIPIVSNTRGNNGVPLPPEME